ncbi:DUF4912 domain-containing protein [Moorellaceae bacterium AZ2]
MVVALILILLIALTGTVWYFATRRRPAARKTMTPSSQRPAALPGKYGKDQIVLLVKDPYWLYAYWEITGDKREEFERLYGTGSWEDSQPVLRVYDLTHNAYDFLHAPYFEIAITDFADNWYIHVGKPSSTFCVDLGRLHPRHGFVVLARSNIVTTPADRPSQVIDPLWPPLEACWKAAGTAKGRGADLSSPALVNRRS